MLLNFMCRDRPWLLDHTLAVLQHTVCNTQSAVRGFCTVVFSSMLLTKQPFAEKYHASLGQRT